MSRADLDAYCEVIGADESLMSGLRVITDREEFKTRLAGLGRAAGFEFSEDEVEQVMLENQLVWRARWG